MATRISVVVPVHNGEKTIAACIESLLALDYPRDDIEIIIVDNRSTDSTRDIVARYPVTCLSQPRRGAAAARNAGIRRARGEYVAFTDSDCTVDPRWLSELATAFADPRVACAGGEIVNPPPASDLERYYASHNPISQKRAIEKDYILFPHAITANAMFRKGIFDTAGLFDEQFPTAGGEDVDLGWRIHWAGYAMRYVPGAVVVHMHKSSVRQLFRQHFRYGYTTIILMRKHPRLYEGLPPRYFGIYGGELRTMGRAVKSLVKALFSRRGAREIRFAWYHFVRYLGEYGGRFVGTVRL